MSDILADLATWLPSEFLSDGMADKTLFHHVAYDFASSSSTESESDDDDIAALTCRFTRSVSLQDRLKIPHPHEKMRVYPGYPESSLSRNVSGHTHARSSPVTPFGLANENCWDLIHVARMKMKMNAVSDGVFANGGLLAGPRPLGAPLSHHHYIPNGAIRQQQLRQRVIGGASYDCGGRSGTGGPVGFCQSAWPTLPVENQRCQQPANGFVVKPAHGGSSAGCGRGIGGVKKERAGTGVFLPRNYSNPPRESNKTAACFPAHLPASPQRLHIHGGFGPQYQAPPLPHRFKRDELAELVMAGRTGVMLAQQRRSIAHAAVSPELVLPQEWTY